MALALLDVLGINAGAIELRIDTGTNPYYQLKIGKEVRRRHGIDFVDDVSFTTPVARNPRADHPFDTATTITVPARHIDGVRAVAQLLTFKSPTGRAPGFSDVVRIGVDALLAEVEPMSTVQTLTAFAPARAVPCRTATQELARATSLGDLIGQVIRLAGPVVANLLNTQAPAPNGGTAAPPSPVTAEAVSSLLTTLLRAVSGPGSAPVATTQSIDGNRFARPMVFGIDDALLATLVGPLVQALPQLANAANQRRLGLRQADNKLVTDILAGLNQQLLLQQLLDAGRWPAADPRTLEALLQQVAAAAPAGAVPTPSGVVTTPQSIGRSQSLSARAVLTFVTAPPAAWNGTTAVLYRREHPLSLRARLDVAAPVPTRALPRAILTLTFKDARDETVLAERSFRLRDVQPGTEVALTIEPAELAGIPTGRRIAVVGELRWPGSLRERTFAALGSTELVLVGAWFLERRGAAVDGDRELTDLVQHRAFWNKVWESPSLDAARGDEKRRWELDVSARYSVVLTPEHDSNGLMETRVLAVPDDAESLTLRTAGRMKAGVELSVSELNKLSALWDGDTELAPDRVEALRTQGFAADAASELLRGLKVDGRADERGAVWIGPVLRRVELTLASARTWDDHGQVAEVDREVVRFPLPAAMRILTVRSSEDETGDVIDREVEAEPVYAIEGWAVERSEKVALEPVAPNGGPR